MIWSLSWKNVWRSKKRSMIVIFATTLGVVAGVFAAGLMNGWIQQRVDAAIYTECSHVKIHNQDYLLNEDIQYTIPGLGKIENDLKQNPSVVAYSSRLKTMAMAATSWGNTALMLEGMNLDNEKKVSNLYEKIIPGGGNYFDTEMRNPIVISDKTAEYLRIKNYEISNEALDSLKASGVPENVVTKLIPSKDKRYKTEKIFRKELTKLLKRKEIKEYGQTILTVCRHYILRSKIVFTFTGENGELLYQTFKVCGVYKTSNTAFDQMNAFVLKDDLAKVLGFSDNDSHEIGIILNKETSPDDFCREMRGKYPGISFMSWKDLAPDASMMADYMDFYYYVIMGFILFALAFGIINTMLMAILERTKELGMLMAIGMNKKRVFRMIMLETIFLTTVGAIVGMVLGYIVIAITGHTGLNFSSVSEGFEAMGWAAVVYPNIAPGFFLAVTVMVVITGILSSIIPARKALKLNPVEAIRTE